jgi:hypothetical protein
MRTNTMLNILMAGAALAATSPFAQAQTPETKESLQKKLQARYKLTKLTADKTGLVTAGAILTLKKDGFLMVPSTSTLSCVNQYKGEKITIGALARASCDVGARHAGGAPRKFVEGEKLNVTVISVSEKSVLFELYSKDAYADVYYRAGLSFPIEKGSLPSADELLAATGEVFSVAPPEDTNTAPAPAQTLAAGPLTPEPAPVPAATPTPQPIKYEEIAPPPPPPAPTVELKKGLTIDQVVAQLGQPVTTAKVSDIKQIYLFKEWKITFINGKVADMDVR